MVNEEITNYQSVKLKALSSSLERYSCSEHYFNLSPSDNDDDENYALLLNGNVLETPECMLA